MPRPATQLIAMSHDSGHVQIVAIITTEYAADGSVNWTVPFTPELAQQEIAKHREINPHLGPVASWRTIERSQIPTDPGDITGSRIYRNAWRDTGSALTHDVESCKSLAMEHLRNSRDDQLGLLDKRWMRAMAKKDAEMSDAIELRRQYLRDVPQTVDVSAATSMAEVHDLLAGQLAQMEAVALERTAVAMDNTTGFVSVAKV